VRCYALRAGFVKVQHPPVLVAKWMLISALLCVAYVVGVLPGPTLMRCFALQTGFARFCDRPVVLAKFAFSGILLCFACRVRDALLYVALRCRLVLPGSVFALCFWQNLRTRGYGHALLVASGRLHDALLCVAEWNFEIL